jgi:rod shape-determining protein MreB
MGFLPSRRRAGSLDLAIDLGTAATRLHGGPRVAPVSRPSVVWREGGQRAALARGVVVDTDAAASVVEDLLRAVPRRRWRRPSALATVPSDASPEERAAVVEAVLTAGLGAVVVAPEPLAAAVGAGLEVDRPRAQLVVDVGEGVTDCAVVRDGVLVASAAVRVALADLRAALRSFAAEQAGVRISPVEAERALRELGVGPGRWRPSRLRVVGLPSQGLGPVRADLDADEVLTAIAPVVDAIEGHVGRFLLALPRDLAAETRDAGLCLTGGGALLAGLADRLVAETGLAVRRARDPLNAVIEGAHRLASGEFHPETWGESR